jgi:PEGA domain
MACHWVVLTLSSLLLQTSSLSPTAREVAAFRGSTERGLLEARARVQRGVELLRRGRLTAAVQALRQGADQLEDSFDRLPGLTEIVQAWLLLIQAELRAGQGAEARSAAEVIAVLGQVPPVDSPSSVRALLEDAARRVRAGPHAVVRVTSVVKGQTIEVDGQTRGVTPERLELPIGRHFIWVQTPLGPIPYRVDLREGESVRVGQGETDELPEDWDAELAAPVSHAARRPVLPHRR